MGTVINSPQGDITIRPTREGDAPAYRELRLEGLRAHPEAFGADYESLAARSIDHWQDRMRQGAGGEHGITYVAVAHGALLGMTVLQRGELPKLRHWGHIFGVYVRPEWRGAGIADALIEACASFASTLGLRLLKLGVVTTNTSAIRLYQRCGFRVYGVEPEAIGYNGVYYDELLMARRVE
jgi:ribosomal protein S18 acetylase RimI-like enzyme